MSHIMITCDIGTKITFKQGFIRK